MAAQGAQGRERHRRGGWFRRGELTHLEELGGPFDVEIRL
jgi:hypothetical protein